MAMTGLMPSTKMSSGVMIEPPPIPVMPTRMPTIRPKKMMMGSMVGNSASLGDSGLHGEDRGLNPVFHMKFVENASHVILDRAVADDELLGDVVVLQALGEQAQDLLLARRQLRRELGGRRL